MPLHSTYLDHCMVFIGSWRLLISVLCVLGSNQCYRNDVIIQAAIAAHSELIHKTNPCFCFKQNSLSGYCLVNFTQTAMILLMHKIMCRHSHAMNHGLCEPHLNVRLSKVYMINSLSPQCKAVQQIYIYSLLPLALLLMLHTFDRTQQTNGIFQCTFVLLHSNSKVSKIDTAYISHDRTASAL